ncbi:hypothetical protein NQD34_005714 [Periophthalmus magnuspinnatus]|nr:hypothetical protein NQD34_005714 [Periophthalmus magnuspinnatus]
MEFPDICDIISSTTDTLLSVGSRVAKFVPTHRECTVELSNDTSTYSLCNPRSFIKSGNCVNPLQPSIPPSTSATALFSKTPYRTQGSVGAFTYDVCDETKNAVVRVAVMFKVPFNNKKHPIMYGVGIFDVNKSCDRELYQEMSKSTGTFVSGGAKDSILEYKSANISILASMSDGFTPVMKVQVKERLIFYSAV